MTDVTESTFSFEYVLARRILHEIGHSLNAVHDNSSEYNYNIMAPLEILVEDKNNTLFSKPSLYAITKYVFEVCINFLVDINIRNCGNGILDKGEECDEGHKNFNVNFKCCNKYCKLNKEAKCSDSNHDCCLNCNIASTNISCYPKVFYQCIDESFCDGINPVCPKPRSLPDNTRCMKNGAKCLNGKCVDKCKSLNENFVHCICEDNNYRCHQCCKSINNGICKPIMDKILLEEGSICSNFNKNFRCNNESKCIYNSSLNYYNFHGVKRKKWTNYYIQNIVTILFILFLPIFIFLKARKNYFQIKKLHNNEIIMKAYKENN